jgi:hypothetical protein
MAKLESAMVSLGTKAPPFALEDVLSGRTIGRDEVLAGKGGLLVMFVCVHCPYVKHVEAELGRIGREFGDRMGVVAIQPNAVEQYPEDGREGMREQAERLGWTFPYLLDGTQEVARRYDAVCTPDLFLFDQDARLVYRGQMDSSRPRRKDSGNDLPVTGEDLRAAIDAVLSGRAPAAEQRAGIGCSIKWRES